jgi:hypothetical protein
LELHKADVAERLERVKASGNAEQSREDELAAVATEHVSTNNAANQQLPRAHVSGLDAFVSAAGVTNSASTPFEETEASHSYEQVPPEAIEGVTSSARPGPGELQCANEAGEGAGRPDDSQEHDLDGVACDDNDEPTSAIRVPTLLNVPPPTL